MKPRGVLVWACVLELLGSGCTVGREATPPVQAAAPGPPSPACPESIAAEAPLEADYGPRIHARQWWPALAPSRTCSWATTSLETRSSRL